MYGFRKVKGSFDLEFRHPFFRKDHVDYLFYIKRKSSHGDAAAKEESKDGDISPSRFLELKQQFLFLNEKLSHTDKEIERLSEENAKLKNVVTEIDKETQTTLRKAVTMLILMLSRMDSGMNREMRIYLDQTGVYIDNFLPLVQTLRLEHLIEQNDFIKALGSDRCESIIESLLQVTKQYLSKEPEPPEVKSRKQEIKNRTCLDLDNKLIIPTISHKLTLNVMYEAVEIFGRSLQSKGSNTDVHFPIS